MRLTKLGHSCIRLEKDGATLVIDPGIWSGPDVLSGAQAVLVTHEHADHLDPDAVTGALGADRGLQLWANPSVADRFGDFGSQVHSVADGDVISPAGFDVHVYGRDHALISPEIPLVANTGFAVDGTVFHPGDSYTVPQDRVPTLLLPVAAPWLKFSELIDYARAVAPERGGYAIHDAILSPQGLGLVASLLQIVAKPGQGQFTRLEPGTAVEL